MLTIAEVLAELEVPRSTFYRWLGTGARPVLRQVAERQAPDPPDRS